jgi:hypothetical protein
MGREYKHNDMNAKTPRNPNTRVVASVLGLALGLGALVASGPAAGAHAPAAKYYFRIGEVKAGPEVDAALKDYAAQAVKEDLAARPEWASDVGATEPEALVAELKKRNLRGFSVVVRFENLKKELKEPGPGAHRKRAAVTVKLSVFGTTIPEEKLAFSGEGEAGTEAEVPDKGVETETQSLAKDVIKDAVKQAVDQAVLKLSLAKASTPMNESKRKKKK